MFFEVAVVLCAAGAVWVLCGSDRPHVLRRVLGTRERPQRSGERSSVRWRSGPWPRVAALAGAATLLTALLGWVGVLAALAVGAHLWWRTHRRGEFARRLPVTDELPVLIGLIASGVRAGATLPACLGAVSGAARGDLGAELSVVRDQLRLGAEPALAWRRSALPEPLVAVGQDLARAAETGAPVADLLDRHVRDLRRRSRAAATGRVERLGVLVVAPLGLCFLPAFVLIGIVPMAAELLLAALAH
ncbi:type II secretion system F family protein [Nocardiopsis sp. B62]|uniref:type II secretion system F family protein n=1 Tax=Nocardiopsis sp. B62 TaxID=2824874 RepID=UPI001B37DCA9|nr:type II secretion system F family protein [Nocardiopsis sp. B62]MBQ1083430.1 type II secretion system F family protein [Nocardiopsis sp. B62]